jgi:cytochrome c biogenesis protein CcmG, thiol:disulfide interchange protein DsbE
MDAASARPRLISRRLALGAAFLVGAPALAYAVTRPLGSGIAGITGSGGAAKGIAPMVDYEAPNFRLKDPSGKDVELLQLRGKPVLLNFWATWCVPCREELPELELLYRELKAKGLVVLAVSVDAEQFAKDIPEFLKAGDPVVGAYTFPVGLDTKQDVQKQYKLLGVPQSFFIDATGVIRVAQPRVMNRQMMLDGIGQIMPGAM